MDERYPVYALADLTVQTRDDRKEAIAGEVIEALCSHFGLPCRIRVSEDHE